jgi:hypothetical protein
LQRPQLQEQGLVDGLQFGHDGLLRRVLGLGRGLQICNVRLSRRLICADCPERLEVVGHHGIGDVYGGVLSGNLQLPGHTRSAVAGDDVVGVRKILLLASDSQH